MAFARPTLTQLIERVTADMSTRVLGVEGAVLRRSLLDSGRAVEAELRLEDLSEGFLIGNAVRGLVPARLLA